MRHVSCNASVMCHVTQNTCALNEPNCMLKVTRVLRSYLGDIDLQHYPPAVRLVSHQTSHRQEFDTAQSCRPQCRCATAHLYHLHQKWITSSLSVMRSPCVYDEFTNFKISFHGMGNLKLFKYLGGWIFSENRDSFDVTCLADLCRMDESVVKSVASSHKMALCWEGCLRQR